MDSKQLNLCLGETSSQSQIQCVAAINQQSAHLPLNVEVSFLIQRFQASSSIQFSLQTGTATEASLSIPLENLFEEKSSFDQWLTFPLEPSPVKIRLSGSIHNLRPKLLTLHSSGSNCSYLDKILRVQNLQKFTHDNLETLKVEMGGVYHKLMDDSLRFRSPLKRESSVARQSRSPRKLIGRTPRFSRSNSIISNTSKGGNNIEIPSNCSFTLNRIGKLDQPIIVLSAVAAKNKQMQTAYLSKLSNNLKNLGSYCQDSLKTLHTEQENMVYQFQEHSSSIPSFEMKEEGTKTDISSLLEMKEKLEKSLIQVSEIQDKANLDEFTQLNENFIDLISLRNVSGNELIAEVNTFVDSLSKINSQIEKTEYEKSSLERELNQSKILNEDWNREIRNLKNKILCVESSLHLEQLDKSHHEFLQRETEKSSKAQSFVQSHTNSISQGKSEILMKSSKQIAQLKQNCSDLEFHITKFQSKSKAFQDSIQINISNLKETNAYISELNYTFDKLKSSENRFMRNERDLLINEDSSLKSELDYLGDLTLKWTSISAKATRTFQQISLLENQKEHEHEITEEAMIEMKNANPVYIHEPSDPIDSALAYYLNQKDETLQVPFQKVSHGVYLFGSKKVLVKVDRNKVQVKVGGGFLPLDQFLVEYQDLENDRIQNRSPTYSPEAKKIMGKWAESVIDSREKSPIRMREQLVEARNLHRKSYCMGVKDRSPSKRSRSNSISANKMRKITN